MQKTGNIQIKKVQLIKSIILIVSVAVFIVVCTLAWFGKLPTDISLLTSETRFKNMLLKVYRYDKTDAQENGQAIPTEVLLDVDSTDSRYYLIPKDSVVVIPLWPGTSDHLMLEFKYTGSQSTNYTVSLTELAWNPELDIPTILHLMENMYAYVQKPGHSSYEPDDFEPVEISKAESNKFTIIKNRNIMPNRTQRVYLYYSMDIKANYPALTGPLLKSAKFRVEI